MPSVLGRLTRDLRARHTTSVELTRRAIGAALDDNGQGEFVYSFVDEEGAMQQASAMDALRDAGVELSPLMGIPISVKDLFDVTGQVTRAGSLALAEAPVATHDAIAIARLRRAGLVVVGRTNMVEFAFSGLGLNPHYGTPLNPFERAVGRIPGGSSSGAAVSVTDAMCSAAIGSDTGGSVRIPAALCGITGFKPSAHRIPLAGALPLSPSLDSIGPLAWSVSCCAQLDAVMSGVPIEPVRAVEPADIHALVPTNVVLDGLDDGVARAFDQSLSDLSHAGVRIVQSTIPELDELAHINAQGGLAAAESYAWHRALLAQHAAKYDPRVRVRIERGARQSAADYIELVAARAAWIARVNAHVARFDALLLPTVAITAPPLAPLVASDDLYTKLNALVLRNTSVINFLDGCALSVPCHEPDLAPVGLMIAAPRDHDSRILSIGLAIERVLARRRAIR
jgi:aspartyl-tRNA(Asn)/glutamyl-tRNA(Gln) amidotransferase subunit A